MVDDKMPKPDKDAWLRKAEEAFERFLGKDERWKEPRTFDELEREAFEIGDRLTSWLLEKGLGRREAEWTSGAEAAWPRCGDVCQPKDEGPAVRDVETPRGGVTFSRRGYYCGRCRRVFFSSRPRTEPQS